MAPRAQVTPNTPPACSGGGWPRHADPDHLSAARAYRHSLICWIYLSRLHRIRLPHHPRRRLLLLLLLCTARRL
jgi:hypothetical protein